jgi:hypothetical protein
MKDLEAATLDTVSKKVVTGVNVLCPGMLLHIPGSHLGPFVVNMKQQRFGTGSNTVACFLDFHQIEPSSILNV